MGLMYDVQDLDPKSLAMADPEVRVDAEIMMQRDGLKESWNRQDFLEALHGMKKVLFAAPKADVIKRMGEAWLREAAGLVGDLQRRVRENGWRYYVAQPYQEEFHRSKRRLRVVLGGNRSGKTCAGVWEAVTFALGFNPYKPDLYIPVPSKIVLTSKTAKTMKEYVNDYVFQFLPRREIKRIERLKGDILDYVDLHNGSRITFMSYDQGRERFQGFSAFAVHLDEEPPEDIWHEVMPRLVDQKGFAWFTMTPLLGLTWVYHDLWLNPDDDPEFQGFEWNIYDNACLDPDEIDRMLAKYPEEIRAARSRGAFLGVTGIVYPWLCSDAAYAAPFAIPEDWQRFRSIDPSASGITACLWGAVDPENNLWFYREYYARDRTVSQHCDFIRQMSGTETYVMDLIDSASMEQNKEIGRTTFQMYQEGLAVGGGRTPLLMARKDIIPGVETVWEYCRSAEAYVARKPGPHPYLRVFANLENFRMEARKYRWQERQSGPEKGERTQKPVHRSCHLLDALRYACHYGITHRKLIKPVGMKVARARRYRDGVTGY